MIDGVQLALLFIIIVLTILLLALGVQVFFILRELRRTVSKANKVLDDTGVITESVSGPISNISAVTAGLKTGMSIVNLISGKRGKKEKNGKS